MRRRDFLHATTTAGVAALLGTRPGLVAAEPPPETTRIRLPRYPFDVACVAPQWVAEELLRAEGFSDVQYVETKAAAADMASGALDLVVSDVVGLTLLLDAGKPIVILAGVHGGCYELFGTDRIRSVKELKGRTVAVSNEARRAFVVTMASYVGLDPRADVSFALPSPSQTSPAMQLFKDGKADAFLGFPPEPQELRARKIGHVVVNTGTDRPWSQYFCCMVTANREFVRKQPVATKRALRAILKATDVCAAEPQRAAQLIGDRGYVKQREYSLQTLREVRYDQWREYSAADTIRFYALRMHEAGVIKSSPQKLIAQGTDWRFLNELKKELKA